MTVSFKIFPLLFLQILPVFFSSLYAQEQKKIPFIPTPEETRNTPIHFMRNLGEKADFFCNRIRFKISYSIYKSGEYFRLAASAPKDAMPRHGRDLKKRLEIKKDEVCSRISSIQEDAVAKGKEKIRQETEKISDSLQHHKDAAGRALQTTGQDFTHEAHKEIKRRTDGLIK